MIRYGRRLRLPRRKPRASGDDPGRVKSEVREYL